MHPTKNSGYVINMLQLDYKKKEMLVNFVLATKMSSLKWQGVLRAWSFGILNSLTVWMHIPNCDIFSRIVGKEMHFQLSIYLALVASGLTEGLQLCTTVALNVTWRNLYQTLYQSGTNIHHKIDRVFFLNKVNKHLVCKTLGYFLLLSTETSMMYVTINFELVHLPAGLT